MAKRGDKRRRKAKRKRPQSTYVRWFEAGPLRVEQHGRTTRTSIDVDHPDFPEFVKARDEMIAELPTRIGELRREIQEKLRQFDAFDVVADLWLANVPKDRETYRESVEEGQLVLVELAASLLIDRQKRDGSAVEPEAWFAPHLYGTQEKLRDLLYLEQHRIMSSMTTSRDPVYEEIRARARSHRLAVRGVSYPWQEEATTRELCGEGALGDDLARLTGFSVDEAFRLAQSVTDIGLHHIEERIRHAHAYAEGLAATIDNVRRGVPAADIPKGLEEVVIELARRKKREGERWARYAAASWASAGSGTTLSFDVSELAADAQVSASVAEAFLARFTTTFGLVPASGLDPSIEDLRERPILDDGDGNYLCGSPHNLLWAIRSAFESAARDAGEGIWRRYEAHRRRTVERRAVAALENAVQADWSRSGAHYEADDDGTTKRFELDGIVRADAAAFVIESKASAMRPAARRGAPDALRDWLKAEVGKGGLQLRRARGALFDAPLPERAVLTDAHGAELGVDLGGVEHVVELVVVLEDLPNIAPVTWSMAEAGFLPTDEPPIVISLHELEIICDISSRPCELVHYFLRRKRLNRQQRVTAMDELDFFMHYLRDGLYWDDTEGAEGESPQSRVLHQLASFTDDLDAYYMYTRGERRTPAAKPEKRHHRDVAAALSLLDDSRQPGRIAAALALLDLDSKARERIVGDMKRLKKLAASGGTTRDRSYFGPDFGITVMAVPPSSADELPEKLQKYCFLKKHQMKMTTWAGFGVFAGPPELFQTAVVWSSPWEPDAELDQLVSELPSHGFEGARFDGRKHAPAEL